MKSEHAQAYGVFKPVGHVVVALPDADAARGATAALLDEGFRPEDIAAYTPAQMVAQTDVDLDQASVLAGIGQELNLVKAQRELAQQGHHFLVVRAPDDDATARVAAIARRFGAARAQKYGRLLIEELIDVGSGEPQVAESPERGLDAQTRSGGEGASPR